MTYAQLCRQRAVYNAWQCGKDTPHTLSRQWEDVDYQIGLEDV